jgi:hypothetical protein
MLIYNMPSDMARMYVDLGWLIVEERASVARVVPPPMPATSVSPRNPQGKGRLAGRPQNSLVTQNEYDRRHKMAR